MVARLTSLWQCVKSFSLSSVGGGVVPLMTFEWLAKNPFHVGQNDVRVYSAGKNICSVESLMHNRKAHTWLVMSFDV